MNTEYELVSKPRVLCNFRCVCYTISTLALIVIITFLVLSIIHLLNPICPKIDFVIESVSNITSARAVIHTMAKINSPYKLELVYIRKNCISNNYIFAYDPKIGKYFNIVLDNLLSNTSYLIYFCDISKIKPSITSNNFTFRTL